MIGNPYKHRLRRLLKRLINWVRQRPPLVSVIITSYNHGRFLPDAINSVLTQKWNLWSPLEEMWSPVEIIVVDDGSTDNTRAVAKQYARVQYIHQYNQGLSAARNTGARASKGNFLVFLDADDWLYFDALDIGFFFMRTQPELAFVSGGFDRVDMNKNILTSVSRDIGQDHYLRLLEGNYIGMHATVMYRRELFDTFQYDTSLTACEDYDLYLKIAREKPVAHHTHRIAAYRQHTQNMSSNIPLMLSSVLDVLSRQKLHLRTESEKQAYERGVAVWTDYYTAEMNRQASSD